VTLYEEMPLRSDVAVDSELRALIARIPAVDNHAHATPARQPDPFELDADALAPSPFLYPVRLRMANPEFIDAWRALYAYPYDDLADIHLRELLRAKLALMASEGRDYPAWVLDQVNIERMLVCMPALGLGQTAPRYLWVPYADGLLSPFAPTHMMGGTFDPGEPPNTLSGYLDSVVRPQLEAWRATGAVAIKFAIAYRRSLAVSDVSAADADTVYDRQLCGHHLHGTVPAPAEILLLEDYLFRAVAREAGAHGLPVHIHTGVGSDPHFAVAGSNPLLLEPTFNDPDLRQTTFVMLHGGWPFEHEAGVMLMKPNVYADFSAQTFLRSTRALSEVLEAWLTWYPEKVLFGTDACPNQAPLITWEETLWVATRSARDALALALTRMLHAGEVTRAHAESLAHHVLRDNALALYGWA
jgi:uncharacterized protein